tara:strand:+ start:184 stop:414 length:231 start_codon:yes stop_codon:yes gene_type:complete
MIIAIVVAMLVGLVSVFVTARVLYKYGSKNGSLDEKKSNLINGVIIGFVFSVSAVYRMLLLSISYDLSYILYLYGI